MKMPDRTVGHIICRKVTSGEKPIRQTCSSPSPIRPMKMTSRGSSPFSSDLPTAGAQNIARMPMTPVA
ncbi:hypothetical protein D3C73_1650890 [compost metagenome]